MGLIGDMTWVASGPMTLKEESPDNPPGRFPCAPAFAPKPSVKHRCSAVEEELIGAVVATSFRRIK